jgi:ATP-dependent RNA helicase DeaD
VVLDEADEMLRMGFIDDVEWILEHTPAERQTALFSATMPEPIRRVAQPPPARPAVEVKIKASHLHRDHHPPALLAGERHHKLDALTRILEVEEDLRRRLVFVRTKTATEELAEKLEARGYAAAALNGDMNQGLRERVEQLKNGALDIVVATDVAARGIDVPRISHVINYDIPYDTEAYVHRIGRTGRAGRKGDAILFVAPRETRMLRKCHHRPGPGHSRAGHHARRRSQRPVEGSPRSQAPAQGSRTRLEGDARSARSVTQPLVGRAQRTSAP